MSLTEKVELINSFEKLGLSPNEARVYLALLENHPITGYQLSKSSGILRPVVYEMLNRLVEKGGARIVKSTPDSYSPVEIKEFLRNIEIDFSDARKNISMVLKDFMVVEDPDYFWNVIGMKNIMNSISKSITSAENEIYISVNNQDLLDLISENIIEKLKDVIKIDLFSYYKLQTGGLTLYTYNLDPSFTHPLIKTNIITLSVDAKKAAIANITDNKSSKSVFSENAGLVQTVRQNILNNIYLNRLWRLIGIDKLKLTMNDEDKKLLEAIDKYLITNM